MIADVSSYWEAGRAAGTPARCGRASKALRAAIPPRGKLTDLEWPSVAQVAADKVKPDTWNAHLDCRASFSGFREIALKKWKTLTRRFGKIGIASSAGEAW